MSQENVDFVLASYEWGHRERKFPRDFWHPDGEYVNSHEDPDHATYRGFEAIDELFAFVAGGFPRWRGSPGRRAGARQLRVRPGPYGGPRGWERGSVRDGVGHAVTQYTTSFTALPPREVL
jgi:hypothetical protein